MRLRQLVLVALLLVPLAGVVPDASSTPSLAAPAPPPPPRSDSLPLLFVENRGQTDAQVAFTVLGGPNTVFFTASGVTYSILETLPEGDAVPRDRPPGEHGSDLPRGRRWTVKLDFVGASRDALPTGEDPAQTVVSYFRGRPDEWHTGLRTFRRIVYRDLWPGIDLAYFGAGGALKYEFTVHPGADPGRILLNYRGADVDLDEAGGVTVNTPAGSFTDTPPVAWQQGPARRPVAVSYSLPPASAERTSASPHADSPVQVGFRVGSYDTGRDLILDPVVLLYCGFIGGAGNDYDSDIAADAAGNLYVTGRTNWSATTFPVIVGPDLTFNGNYDAFVAKVNPSGSALVYAGFLGGRQDEGETGIAVDQDGSAYVTGSTLSPEDSFPVLVGPDLTFNGGGSWDAFIAKVDPTGVRLLYSGYIGGRDTDIGEAVAVDAARNAYVTGYTRSQADSFPVLIGPELRNDGHFGDAFVAKVDASGAKLLYAGYIGGYGEDDGHDIAVDGAGAAYVTGETESLETTFPVIGGPDLTYNGDRDAFVAKVIPGGAGLAYAGYIGGPYWDSGAGIAVDAGGNAYVTGWVRSGIAIFQGVPGPDTTFNGGADVFIAKIAPGGTRLAYAGYIGGAADDYGLAVVVGAGGDAYVTGRTSSDEMSFLVLDGPGLTYKGGPGGDAFVTAIDASGSALLYSGYIGGVWTDEGHALAMDGQGDVYVSGDTDSDDTSFPSFGGLSDSPAPPNVFVAKLGRSGATIQARKAGVRPVIDGDLREWQALPAVPLDRTTAFLTTGSEPDPPPADLSAGLWSAWRTSVLYFAVSVTDDVLVGDNSAKPWNDDAIDLSLYIPETQQQYCFTIGLDGRQYQNGYAIDKLTVVTRPAAGGWSVEVVIPAWVVGLDAFAEGQAYPFTFAAWDDDTFGFPSQTHMIWEGSATDTYVRTWGALALNPAVYDFPPGDVTSTPTPTASTTPTGSPTATAIATVSATPTATATATSTATPTETTMPTATATATATPSNTPTATPRATRAPGPYLPLVLR